MRRADIKGSNKRSTTRSLWALGIPEQRHRMPWLLHPSLIPIFCFCQWEHPFQMLLQQSVFNKFKVFKSDTQVRIPTTIPFNHILLFRANVFEVWACFKHSNLLSSRATTHLWRAPPPGKNLFSFFWADQYNVWILDGKEGILEGKRPSICLRNTSWQHHFQLPFSSAKDKITTHEAQHPKFLWCQK